MAHDSCYGRTYRELSAPLKEQTLLTFLDQWCKGTFLPLGTDGTTLECVSDQEEEDARSGEFWMLNTLESRRDAVDCLLSSILERGGVDDRYYLSPKACRGILRRAKEHRKVLPPQLEEALQRIAQKETSLETSEPESDGEYPQT